MIVSNYSLSDVIAATAVRNALMTQQRYSDPSNLITFGAKVYSQGDEDGIIGEIFRRIGFESRRFVEIGVENGLENNTLALLLSGWAGAWIEGDERHAASIAVKFAGAIEQGRLRLLNRFVAVDNVATLRDELDPAPLDLLSLDIDGNDFHVAPPLIGMVPRVAVVEYNARFGAEIDWVMPYDHDHRWNGTDYFGASLAAWCRMFNALGYGLVSCNLPGTNAFFVRNDCLGDHFEHVDDVRTLYEPARYYLLPAFQTAHPADTRLDKPYL